MTLSVTSDWLWAGRSGGRIPLVREFPYLSRPAHPASCTIGTGSFPGVKSGRGVRLTPHPFLVPWSRKSRAIPLLPLWAVRPVQNLSACTRIHFTFFYHHARLETSAPRGSLLSASSDRGKGGLSVGYPNTKVISVRRTHHCGFQLPHST